MKQSLALIWLLRYVGFVSSTALIAAVMPLSWMDAIHQWLGMGPLPSGPVVAYLARSTSAAYAIFGIFLILFSCDLQRYRTPVFLASGVMLAGGTGLGLFHLNSGMPLYWRIAEPLAVLLMGSVVLILNLRCGTHQPHRSAAREYPAQMP